jgi:hypothetical protein
MTRDHFEIMSSRAWSVALWSGPSVWCWGEDEAPVWP